MKKPTTNPISAIRKAAIVPAWVNSSWRWCRGKIWRSRCSRPAPAGWRAGADGDAAEAEPPTGSNCDLPQNRQNRAPASIALPQERQNTVPAFASGSELDKAAPLYGRRSRSAWISGRRNQSASPPVWQAAGRKFQAPPGAKALLRGYNDEVSFFGSRTVRFKGPDLISNRHATHPATASGLSSLAARRRQIRRQRRSALRTLASGAGWGAVILVSLWLLFSGIFGFLSA